MCKEEGLDYPDKPDDMLTWILESASPENEQMTGSIALRILNINFQSIHTTYVFFAHSVYNLAAQPDYLDILREEAYIHLHISGTVEQYSLEDLENCIKLDSFLKETLRLNDLGSIALPRKALAPLTLADGTVIPVGTIVTSASSSAHLNRAHYENPETFDGLRFAKLREDCESSKIYGDRFSKYSLTSVGSEFLTFGGGRHTWCAK
ncbi:hypothetical protein C0992_005578 [Termitomyces sp. T32_za158]|nr:hypothetical protein C0992_005578 [Termitomyces sp. T32_za158]